MGRSNRFANMNEMYVRMKIACKEQPAILLWHMSGGPNGCRRQPIPRFVEVEGKSIVEHWLYKEDQFKVMRDQIKDLTTQIFNLCGHKGSGSRNQFTESQMRKCQHLKQPHANRQVSRFKLNISKFDGNLEPEEFLDWVLTVEEILEFNGVLDEQQVSLVVRTFRERVSAWWQQPKKTRMRKGKLKINSWEKLLKYMRVAFLLHSYTMGLKSQNWR
jgi:hypothetical protein